MYLPPPLFVLSMHTLGKFHFYTKRINTYRTLKIIKDLPPYVEIFFLYLSMFLTLIRQYTPPFSQFIYKNIKLQDGKSYSPKTGKQVLQRN